MTSGEIKTNLLKKRSYLVSRIEDIIKDSVYYRSHSQNLNDDTKIIIANIKEDSIKKKIL